MFISRFSRSREDFSFYHCTNLQGASVTRAILDQFPSSDTDSEHETESDTDQDTDSDDSVSMLKFVGASAGYEKRHRYQLEANMYKTATDIAYQCLMSSIPFQEIVVYGLIVDYSIKTVPLFLKLHVDYIHRTTVIAEPIDLELCKESVPQILSRVKDSLEKRR